MSCRLFRLACTILVAWVCLGSSNAGTDAYFPSKTFKLVIVSERDNEGHWIQQVKVIHAEKEEAWKVELEHETIEGEGDGKNKVQLTATLTSLSKKEDAPTPQITQQQVNVDERIVEQHLHRFHSRQWPIPRMGFPRESLVETYEGSDEDMAPINSENLIPSSEYKLYPGIGYFKYHPESEEKNWEDARDKCSSEGGHLAIINSEEEAALLSNTVRFQRRFRSGKECAFVGIEDRDDEGHFVTVLGKPLSTTGFTRWFNTNQPDDDKAYDSTGEDCGAVHVNGGLNDVPCKTYMLGFFCEKPEAVDMEFEAVEPVEVDVESVEPMEVETGTVKETVMEASNQVQIPGAFVEASKQVQIPVMDGMEASSQVHIPVIDVIHPKVTLKASSQVQIPLMDVIEASKQVQIPVIDEVDHNVYNYYEDPDHGTMGWMDHYEPSDFDYGDDGSGSGEGQWVEPNQPIEVNTEMAGSGDDNNGVDETTLGNGNDLNMIKNLGEDKIAKNEYYDKVIERLLSTYRRKMSNDATVQ